MWYGPILGGTKMMVLWYLSTFQILFKGLSCKNKSNVPKIPNPGNVIAHYEELKIKSCHQAYSTYNSILRRIYMVVRLNFQVFIECCYAISPIGYYCELLKKSIFHYCAHILLVKLLKNITFEQNCNKDGDKWTLKWYGCIWTNIIINGNSAVNEANFYPIGVFGV